MSYLDHDLSVRCVDICPGTLRLGFLWGYFLWNGRFAGTVKPSIYPPHLRPCKSRPQALLYSPPVSMLSAGQHGGRCGIYINSTRRRRQDRRGESSAIGAATRASCPKLYTFTYDTTLWCSNHIISRWMLQTPKSRPAVIYQASTLPQYVRETDTTAAIACCRF